jgi:nucleoside-diphosphate-sugar epimerase
MEKMNILITGNAGYIGPVLVNSLRKGQLSCTLIGFDNGYFAHCLTGALALPELKLDHQYWGDLRDFPQKILEGIDAVVHLAAISNDPMGNSFTDVTNDINFSATKDLILMSKKMGVKKFIFASSCSIYGFAEHDSKKESDELNPLTTYAKTKVGVEEVLYKNSNEKFVTTALRFATACGMSPRLRLDLVLNDFVASAIKYGVIKVSSDGSPWRPLIDVSDMARAICWALERNNSDTSKTFLPINIGSTSMCYQVKDLANAVSKKIPQSKVEINQLAMTDKRSYQVNFSLFENMAPNFQPNVSLEKSIENLKFGINSIDLDAIDFKNTNLIRLRSLEAQINAGVIDQSLKWL